MDKPYCIVVGASGDLGTATVRRLLSEGFAIAGTYRTASPGDLGFPEADVAWFRLDVTKPQEIARVLTEICSGRGAPYALIYCAGIVRDHPILLMSDEDWNEVLATNLNGVFHCIRSVARDMMVFGKGRIVLLGSTAARLGNIGQGNYAASKAAVEGLCRVVAAELGRYSVTCNVIAAGAIESSLLRHVPHKRRSLTTGAVPLRRLGLPEEVAGAISFLLQPESAYITGQVIVVDGGLSSI